MRLPLFLVFLFLSLQAWALAQPLRWGQSLFTGDFKPTSQNPIAYDQAHKEVLIFDDGMTRLWDGRNWRLASPIGSPPPRRYAALAYDQDRKVVVLYGGQSSQDTWEWDGTTWKPILLSPCPPCLEGASLSYDAGRKKMVLSGGIYSYSRGISSEIWEYDGQSWVKMVNVVKPSGFSEGRSFTYYPPWKTLVAFGQTGSWPYKKGLYKYTGSQILLAGPYPDLPGFGCPEATLVAMHYEGVTGNLVCLGYSRESSKYPGAYKGYFAVVFDGSSWSVQFPNNHTLNNVDWLSWWGSVYCDSDSSVCIIGVHGSQWVGQYRYCSSGITQPGFHFQKGSGCPTSNPPLLGLGGGTNPDIGRSLTLEVRNIRPGSGQVFFVVGFRNDVWFGQILPLDLSGYGLLGCQIYCAMDYIFPPISAAATTTALSFIMPGDFGLVQRTFYSQAFVFGTPGAPLGMATTNELVMKVGNQ